MTPLSHSSSELVGGKKAMWIENKKHFITYKIKLYTV